MKQSEKFPDKITLPAELQNAVQDFRQHEARYRALLQGFLLGNPQIDKSAVYDIDQTGTALIKRKDE